MPEILEKGRKGGQRAPQTICLKSNQSVLFFFATGEVNCKRLYALNVTRNSLIQQTHSTGEK